MPNGGPPGGAAPVYQALVESQLAEERDRKKSLEQRGAAVITVAGTFVTLAFGFTAIVTGATGYKLPGAAVWTLAVSLLLFVAAGGVGVWTNRPLNYQEARVSDLKAVFHGPPWRGTAAAAQRQVALVECDIIETARGLNAGKAELLRWATRTLVAAVFFIFVSAAIILFAGSPAKTPASTTATPTATASP